MNHSINRLQVEIEDLKGQKANLEAAITDAELLEEIAIKDANGSDGGCPEAGHAGLDPAAVRVPGADEHQAGT